ncbi:hypothetical protein P43SY_011278 [Pythium insidiosum]|uniref:Polyprotein n=1 Tax=Pythium insidiosum TaxID=114742 RepID=A0AAD5L9F5_PYTIN|nr:hypothetical protein P43SY_011278 [Pythium insidiosum]
MSPTASNPNEVLRDDNYFLWEFNARMALARNELLDHIAIKPEDAAHATPQWKVADVKALAVLSKLLSPTYQCMIREANSAWEAWTTLREFFVKQSLHNRVQLRKQLHEFTMGPGENFMEHVVRFDELTARLSAIGDKLSKDEKLFQKTKAIISLNKRVVTEVTRAGKLYACKLVYRGDDEAHVAHDGGQADSNHALWHARLGHVSDTKLKLVAQAYGDQCFRAAVRQQDQDKCSV